MIHYHGTPITPVAVLYECAGRHLCVSYERPDDIQRAAQISQSLMLDNGAFSAWTRGAKTDWNGYYAFCDKWLSATCWAVIPDVIDAGTQEQDALLREWPHGKTYGAPVWHMDEPIDRMLRLCDEWPRVCIGSTAEYATVLSESWCKRMDETWDAIAARHNRLPNIHMLRGMQLSGRQWPFGSVDSTDVARNHKRPQNDPVEMINRWDQMQCPTSWEIRGYEQKELLFTRPSPPPEHGGERGGGNNAPGLSGGVRGGRRGARGLLL